LAFVGGDGFNTRNGVVSHRKKGPLVPGDAGASGERQGKVIPGGVAGGG
jgi:hypothetical protein